MEREGGRNKDSRHRIVWIHDHKNEQELSLDALSYLKHCCLRGSDWSDVNFCLITDWTMSDHLTE